MARRSIWILPTPSAAATTSIPIPSSSDHDPGICVMILPSNLKALVATGSQQVSHGSEIPFVMTVSVCSQGCIDRYQEGRF